jgi:N-acetylmuramoyl-L-alanine amidase
MDNKNLLIGAGHGGSDPGAISYGKTFEKTYNLEFSMLVFQKITKYLKTQAYLLRSKDVYISLLKRCEIANSKAPLYWFEFHFNSFNKKTRGIEIITSKFTSQKNKDFASYLCKEFSKEFKTNNRGLLTKTGSNGKDFYYLHRNTNSNVTVFIIEPLFIDNKEDFEILTSKSFMENATNFFASKILENFYNIKMTKDNNIYTVQAGAYSTKENAEKQVELLKKYGIDSIIKTTIK